MQQDAVITSNNEARFENSSHSSHECQFNNDNKIYHSEASAPKDENSSVSEVKDCNYNDKSSISEVSMLNSKMDSKMLPAMKKQDPNCDLSFGINSNDNV